MSISSAVSTVRWQALTSQVSEASKSLHLCRTEADEVDSHTRAGAGIPPTEYYPVALAAGLVGDRWSLLIVRELAARVSGYNEILRALPGLSRSLLSARLRYLERIGVVMRGASANSRYILTESGEDLLPALEALGSWAIKHQMPRGADGGKNEAASMLWRMHRSIELSAVPSGKVRILVVFEGSDVRSGWVQAGWTNAGSWSLGSPEHDVDITVNASLDVLNDLWWGRRACENAIANEEIRLDGPTSLTRGYRSWFPHRPAVSQAE